MVLAMGVLTELRIRQFFKVVRQLRLGEECPHPGQWSRLTALGTTVRNQDRSSEVSRATHSRIDGV